MNIFELPDDFKDARGLKIERNASYIIFVDRSTLDASAYHHLRLTVPVDVLVIPLDVPPGKTVHDVVAAFKRITL